MEKCLIKFQTKDGRILYAKTERLYTFTENKERAKIFTVRKAMNIMEMRKSEFCEIEKI
jgi:hypothetical protein